MRAALRHMTKRGASVVNNVGARMARANPSEAHYAAAKLA
jgi:NAD(P)-dependent dehydrogenase (short-subunit alcohol dehydrogenase family)